MLGSTGVASDRTPGSPGLPCTAATDLEGVVTEWSDGAGLLLGYRQAEIVGRSASVLLAEPISAVALDSLAGQDSWDGWLLLRHRDGHRVKLPVLARWRNAANGPDWLFVSTTATATRRDDIRPVVPGFTQSPCVLALFDTNLRTLRANADFERAVAMSDEQMRGLRLPEIIAHPEADKNERAMRRVLESGERQHLDNYLQVTGESREHAWSISLAPLKDPEGRMRGVCFAARDTTKEYWARQRLLLLSEAGGRIGTTLDMARSAQELVDVAVPRLADLAVVDLLVTPTGVEEPRSVSLSESVELRRAAQQSVLEGCPETAMEIGEVAVFPAFSPPARCLATSQPAVYSMNDPVVSRWLAQESCHASLRLAYRFHRMMTIPISARGTVLGLAVFYRHRRLDSFTEDDLLLAEEITARAAVCIDNARRFARERTTAVTLQQSLLPRSLPKQTAVETHSRYMPAGAQAGVGGDWFDVIPLSGARVALVVGDVVGHGIQASAAMGRLRTAVRTLADIELAPDELLTHLDDLVIRLASEDTMDFATAGDIGATCLYGVYDPVSRRCTFARAGHPPPVLVSPGGTAQILDLPAGPPLGIGGLPFETMECETPEGSIIALYTDGLVGACGRDLDEGLAILGDVLARPSLSLEVQSDAVLSALLPPQPDDDLTLLLARTHALGRDQVATWDIPSDPVAVAQARDDTLRQLASWGLESASFTTELVVSELVTNAIRYGQPPIQLRIIYDRTLICEVSDRSSTSPHLRRARVSDEGGRGLLLVAQLAQRWGTRHSVNGKTIWAEQLLPNGGSSA